MTTPSQEQVTQARLIEVISHAQRSLAWASAFLFGNSGDPDAQLGRKIESLFVEMQILRKSIETQLQTSLFSSSQEVAEALAVFSVLENLEVSNQSATCGIEDLCIKRLLQQKPAIPYRSYLFIEKVFRKHSEASDQIAENIEELRKKLMADLKP